jgi:murein DD-endopeptidase MepM/ murein hydrolase activator NlpD
MTGRKSERLFFAFVASILVTGCSSSPNTELEWGVRDAPTAHRTAYTKTSYKAAPKRASQCPCDQAVPTPRPSPVWYKPNTNPAPRDEEASTDDTSGIAATDARFSWPMRGRVLSDYGSTTSGERNDGINIAASYGEPIRAAGDGVVSYAGDDLKSYGNLALIKHDGNYVTAYAHAEKFIVSRGDHVAKGQVIGYAGNTGDVSAPQLHFEIRRGVQPINPHPLLGTAQYASR